MEWSKAMLKVGSSIALSDLKPPELERAG